MYDSCWDVFWILESKGGVWSSQDDMHVMFSLAWDEFKQHVVIHFASSMTWAGLGQHMSWYILFPCSHGVGLVNKSWNIFCVLAEMFFFFKKCWEAGMWLVCLAHVVYFPDGMRCVWSTQVEIHFVSSLAWEGFGQMLRFILRPCWHRKFGQHMLRFILCHRRLGIIWTTLVEMYFETSIARKGIGQEMLRYTLCPRWLTFDQHKFLSSLAWEYFAQNMLGSILCLRWHGMSLINTCWDTFAPSMAWDGLGQHMSRYILFPRSHGIGLVKKSFDISCVFA